MKEDIATKLTFFSKNALKCPVCDASFHREEMLTGRGRLIAGELTTDLRRMYEPSKKFGELHPLVYPVTVCPSCYYAAYPGDFEGVPGDARQELEGDTDQRINSIRHIFEELDFTEPRTLKEGAASYYFALMCYDKLPKEYVPSFKQALSSLRAAWVFTDLHKKFPGENYDYLSRLFYRKARFFYRQAVEREQRGGESLAQVKNFGPDTDKNYGYDGVLYLAGLLELEYGPTKDPEKREQSLREARRTVARIFGLGKASKDKPSALLDRARDLFKRIGQELDEGTPVDPEQFATEEADGSS
jgi:uncharacterized protein